MSLVKSYWYKMGHCTVTTNTTDMHSQTEVKWKLTDIANNNMHSLLKVDNTSEKNGNNNVNKHNIKQRILQKNKQKDTGKP